MSLQAGHVPEDLAHASRVAAALRDASQVTTVSRDTSLAAAVDARDASLLASDVVRDGSEYSGDASHGAGAATARPAGRICTWCTGPIRDDARVDAETCGPVCRKRRWRFRRAVDLGRVPCAGERDGSLGERRDASRGPGAGSPARFAYADPPYPGKAGYYEERQEVDHASLLEQLVTAYPDGWALSTSAAGLPHVLPMCPVGIRVCAWRRQHRPTRSRRPLSAWEPLIVYGGRELPTDRPQDVIDHLDYRGRYDSFPGALVGMKPPEFAVWMFTQLGALPGDELDDLYPGSGAIARAWDLYTSHVDRLRSPA